MFWRTSSKTSAKSRWRLQKRRGRLFQHLQKLVATWCSVYSTISSIHVCHRVGVGVRLYEQGDRNTWRIHLHPLELLQLNLVMYHLFNRMLCWLVEQVQRWTSVERCEGQRGALTWSDDRDRNERRVCSTRMLSVVVSVEVHFALYEVTNNIVITF
jgi:hypothetical protein